MYSELGSGHLEKTYQNALFHELDNNNRVSKYGFKIWSEVTMDINYKGIKVGSGRIDLVLINKEKKCVFILELKAIMQTDDTEAYITDQLNRYAQYCPGYKKIMMGINFSSRSSGLFMFHSLSA